MENRLYFEDFPIGKSIPLGSVTFSDEGIVAFAKQFDPQPFHIDPAAAATSPFGGLIASGWHICSEIMRLMCDAYLLRTESMGSPGVDQVRWMKPVRPGDTIAAHAEVLEARPSASKNDRGAVKFRWTATNSAGETIFSMEGTSILRRRTPGAA